MNDGTPRKDSATSATLYMALELSARKWLLGFSDGFGRGVRRKQIEAGDFKRLQEEVRLAKKRFGTPADAPVTSCYEAGRDGFWVHHGLTGMGFTNVVVDPASIEVNRRHRRAKNDGIDVESLVRILVRYVAGDRSWRIVRVPREEDEDARRLHRERERLKKERTQLSNRAAGLLATQGVHVDLRAFPEFLKHPCRWDGKQIGPALRAELERLYERWRLVSDQLKKLEKQQQQQVETWKTDPQMYKVHSLMQLRGVGIQSAWLLVKEFFQWRQFRNRREVGALAGMTGTPYDSGSSEHEQGISKAGNKRVRSMMVELAWLWVRFQPESRLTRWFLERWGATSKRSRRAGIVALARKLLIALWRLVDQGIVPDGARLSTA